MIKEVWKDIDFAIGRYQVSNLGKVKSLPKNSNIKLGKVSTFKGGILAGQVNRYNYSKVLIYGKLYSIHRLVAQAFLENNENKQCVNHKDGNKQNNCLDNLEWVTYKENSVHAVQQNKYPRGKSHSKARAINQYDKNGVFLKKWDTLSDAHRELNVNTGHLSMHLQGKKYKSVKGFKFEYA
jgi:hypothetical protein